MAKCISLTFFWIYLLGSVPGSYTLEYDIQGLFPLTGGPQSDEARALLVGVRLAVEEGMPRLTETPGVTAIATYNDTQVSKAGGGGGGGFI